MKVGLVAVPIVDGPTPLGEPTVDTDLRPVGADAVRPCPPYAIYLLAGVLEAAGHEVVIVDLIASGAGDLTPDGLEDVDLVGLTSTSLSWAAARETMRRLRGIRPDTPIVVGGVHVSLFDTWVLDHSDADMVIRGDGERPLLALCHALESGGDLSEVPSLSWRRDGEVVRNPDGDKVDAEDLTRWMPDYRQLPHRAYWGLALETARGCAFDCSLLLDPAPQALARWGSSGGCRSAGAPRS